MIVNFKIKNYRSYKDEVEYSMLADDNENNEKNSTVIKLIDGEEIKILRFSGIFGANASGKSNVIYALEALVRMIMDSRKYPIRETIEYYDPFKLSSTSAKENIFFSLTFIQRRRMYVYEVEYNTKIIVNERLLLRDKGEFINCFDTEVNGWNNQIKVNPMLKKLFDFTNDLEHMYIPRNHLFLSYLPFIPLNELTHIYYYFKKYLLFTIHSDIDLEVNSKYAIDLLSTTDAYNIVMKRLRKLINISDIGVSNILVKKNLKSSFKFPKGIPTSEKNRFIENNKWGIQFKHRNADKRLLMSSFFEPENESVGTKHLFNIGLKTLLALEKGTVLAIDEMNLAIHPMLFKYLVSMFANPIANKKNAQLIFTTHDASIAGENFMRPDQIWFSQKNENGVSELFCAIDFEEVDFCTPIEMWYRTGRFGAIPSINSMDYIFNDDEE